MSNTATKQFIKVENLKKQFTLNSSLLSKKKITAVDSISFGIEKGKTLGLVGESGCGKSTTARVMIGLYPATDGKFFIDDVDIFSLPKKQRNRYKKNIQMIFQDPYSSLNPRMMVRDIIAEPLKAQSKYSKNDLDDIVADSLRMVGLLPEYAQRFPHEFSGGQRQRIGIARSIIIQPDLVLCDEAISALDVSIQAQIVNMLMELQAKFSLTYLFIAHDLSMVKFISDNVGVMYLGKIVETGETDIVYSNPLHPYTQALMDSNPTIGRRHIADKPPIEGEVPSLLNIPTGCRFRQRCPKAFDRCSVLEPELKEVEGRKVACYLYE